MNNYTIKLHTILLTGSYSFIMALPSGQVSSLFEKDGANCTLDFG